MALADLRTALPISRSAGFWLLRELVERGELVRRGRGRATYYEATTAPVALAMPSPAPDADLLPRYRIALKLAGEGARLTRQSYERAVSRLRANREARPR